MKIKLYFDVQDSDAFVFVRGVITDNPTGSQAMVQSKWLQTPHRTYCLETEIPDLAPTHQLKSESVEVKE